MKIFLTKLKPMLEIKSTKDCSRFAVVYYFCTRLANKTELDAWLMRYGT